MKALFRKTKRWTKTCIIWIVIAMTCLSFYRSILSRPVITVKKILVNTEIPMRRTMKATDRIWLEFQERWRSEQETAALYKNFTHDNMTSEEYEKLSKTVNSITNSEQRYKRAFVPFRQFHYPLDIDIPTLVKKHKKNNGKVDVEPINKYPYSFLKFPKQKCSDSYQNQTFLLYLIKSAPPNFGRRKAIRETWGSEGLNTEFKVKRVFLLGTPKLHGSNDDIDAEIKLYGDILQMSFYDSYYNNSFKTIGGLKWAVRHCRNTKFLVFGDDDFYFATETIVNYLHSMDPAKTRNLFMGKRGQRSVSRYSAGKWVTSASEYPYDKYPPFLLAGAMFMSMEFAIDFSIAVEFTKLFRFDDVYFGIVAYKLGVIPQHNDQIFVGRLPPIYDRSQFRKVIASHNYGDSILLRKVWTIHEKVMKMNFKDG